MALASDRGDTRRFDTSGRSAAPRLLFVSLAIGLGLRLASLVFFSGAMDWEGTEYARLAENLRLGVGYVGLDVPGKNLMFPPLYPWLIAGLSYVVPNYELAARLLAVAFGTALCFPVFLIARHVYDERIGAVAALAVAVHPMLTHFSAAAYSENVYLFWLALAVYASIRAMDRRTARAFAAAGGVWGLAYLTRIEGGPLPAAVLAIFVAIWAWQYWREPNARRALRVDLRNAFWLPAMFALVASPYVVWLHGETGQWRLEGKSPLNLETAKRVVVDNEDVAKVHYEVDADLNERGVWNQPYVVTIQSSRVNARVMLDYLMKKAKDNVAWTVVTLNRRGFGSPVFIGFVLLGLFGALKSRQAIDGHLVLMGVVAVALLESLMILFQNPRLLVVVIPIFAVWAAGGAVLLWAWLLKTVRASGADGPGLRLFATPAIAIAAIISLAPLHSAALGEAPLVRFNHWSRPIKEAALSLSSPAGPNRPVLVGPSYIAYYANAEFSALPYADSETALRYFDKRAVRYIALTKQGTVPYLASWWEKGIPSSSATFIREVGTPLGDTVRFYRWGAPSAGDSQP